MNSLIIFPVIFSIIIGDVYGKSFDFEPLSKLSTIKKRTIEDDVENIPDIQPDSAPCPVIDCLIMTDCWYSSRFDTEEEIVDYINDIINETQNRIDELDLNITFRLIGRISYNRNETEPEFIKTSINKERDRTIYANEVIVNMRHIEKTPIIEKADVVVFITGRQVFASRPKPGEERGEINGMAWSAGACDSVLKFAIVSDDRHLSWTIDTFVHEVGHLFNIPHSYSGEKFEDCSSEALPGEYHPSCARKVVKEYINSGNADCIFDNCVDSKKVE